MAVVDSGRRTSSGAIIWKAAPTTKTYTYTYRSGDQPPKSSDYSSYRDYSRASYAYSKNKRAVTIAKLKSGQSLSSSELRGAGIQSSGGGYRYYDSAAKKYVTTQPTAQILAEKKAAEAKKQQKELEAIKIATTKKEKDIMKLQYAMQQGWFSPGALKKSKKSQQEIMQGMPTVKEKKIAMDIGGQTFTGTYGITRTAPKQSEAVSLPLAQFKTKGKEELNILAPERKIGPQESKAPSYAGQPIYGIRPVSMDVAKNISDNKLLAPVAMPGPQESAIPSNATGYKFDVRNLKPFDMEKHKILDLTMDMSKVAGYRDTKVTGENVGDIEKALGESNLLVQKALLRGQTLSKQQASDIRIGEEVSTKVKDFYGKEYGRPIITLAATATGVGAAGQVLSSLSKVAVVGKLIKVGSPVLKGAWGISIASRGVQSAKYIGEGQTERGLLGFANIGAEVGGVALAGKWLAATQGKPITSLYKQTYSKVKGPFFEREILKWQKGITDKHWIYDKAYSDISGQKTLHGKPISKAKIRWLREDINKGFYNIDPVRTQVSGYDTSVAQQHLTSTYILGKSGKVVKIIPHTDPTRAINVKAIDWLQGKEIVISPKKMDTWGYRQMLSVEPTRFTFINKPSIKEPLYKVIEATHIPGYPDVSVQSQLIKSTSDPFVYRSKLKIPGIKTKKPSIILTKSTPTKKGLFISHKTDRTALDRAAKASKEVFISSNAPEVRTVFVQDKPAATISDFKGKLVPVWSPGTEEKIKTEERLLQLNIPKVKTSTKVKPIAILDISPIQKQVRDQEQEQKPVQILAPVTISHSGSALRVEEVTKQITIPKQKPVQEPAPIIELETPGPTPIIKEPPPRIIVPGLPSLSFSKKRAMPSIDLSSLLSPRKRGVDIAPISDLLSINITEMFTGRRATHPGITEEEKLLFDTGIKRGRQFFPTMEMRAGKVPAQRSFSIFGTTKRKHKKSRKKGDWVFDLL